jgi:hypothetical protein
MWCGWHCSYRKYCLKIKRHIQLLFTFFYFLILDSFFIETSLFRLSWYIFKQFFLLEKPCENILYGLFFLRPAHPWFFVSQILLFFILYLYMRPIESSSIMVGKYVVRFFWTVLGRLKCFKFDNGIIISDKVIDMFDPFVDSAVSTVNDVADVLSFSTS